MLSLEEFQKLNNLLDKCKRRIEKINRILNYQDEVSDPHRLRNNEAIEKDLLDFLSNIKKFESQLLNLKNLYILELAQKDGKLVSQNIENSLKDNELLFDLLRDNSEEDLEQIFNKNKKLEFSDVLEISLRMRDSIDQFDQFLLNNFDVLDKDKIKLESHNNSLVNKKDVKSTIDT
ncbi:MAG: hypothetical protein HRT87_10345 [Legionellales bacterium]|nr:hypothetical protein [Legionellales bacterium]